MPQTTGVQSGLLTTGNVRDKVMLKWGKLTGVGAVSDLGDTMPRVFLLRRIVAGATVGLCALLSAAAIAADLGGRGSIKDAPALGASRWVGFYAGGQIGHGKAFYSGAFDNGELEELLLSDLDLSGTVGGAHVGYNLQKGKLVFGVEADFNWTGLQDKQTFVDGENFITGSIDWLATVRGRLGFATDRTLIYATGGVAFADAEYTSGENGEPAGPGKLDFAKAGVVVGGGAEYALTDRISLRVQGLYYVFNERRETSTLSTDSNPGDFAKFEDAYTITVGASYRF
jgi:outer membrane immunogenic protein